MGGPAALRICRGVRDAPARGPRKLRAAKTSPRPFSCPQPAAPLGLGRGPPPPRLGPGPPGWGWGKPTLRLRAPRGSWGRTAVAPLKITSNAQGWTIGLMDLGVFWSQRCARSFGEWLRTKPGKAEARMAVGEGGAPHAVLAHAGPGSGGARAPPLQLAPLVPPWAPWGGVWAVSGVVGSPAPRAAPALCPQMLSPSRCEAVSS